MYLICHLLPKENFTSRFRFNSSSPFQIRTAANLCHNRPDLAIPWVHFSQIHLARIHFAHIQYDGWAKIDSSSLPRCRRIPSHKLDCSFPSSSAFIESIEGLETVPSVGSNSTAIEPLEVLERMLSTESYSTAVELIETLEGVLSVESCSTTIEPIEVLESLLSAGLHSTVIEPMEGLESVFPGAGSIGGVDGLSFSLDMCTSGMWGSLRLGLLCMIWLGCFRLGWLGL